MKIFKCSSTLEKKRAEEKYRSRAMENSGLVSSRFYPLLTSDEYIEHIECERERVVSGVCVSPNWEIPHFLFIFDSLSLTHSCRVAKARRTGSNRFSSSVAWAVGGTSSNWLKLVSTRAVKNKKEKGKDRGKIPLPRVAVESE